MQVARVKEPLESLYDLFGCGITAGVVIAVYPLSHGADARARYAVDVDSLYPDGHAANKSQVIIIQIKNQSIFVIA